MMATQRTRRGLAVGSLQDSRRVAAGLLWGAMGVADAVSENVPEEQVVRSRKGSDELVP